ncbi:MAG: peptidoglycan-binding protein [Rhodospirillales bacterium]|nr:peptidoglycan-binding protein [Rhodospirillales bacterium]
MVAIEPSPAARPANLGEQGISDRSSKSLASKGGSAKEDRSGQTKQTSDARVAEAQSLLTVLGYQVGPVDGKIGRQTRAAIREFEKKRGLEVDGRLDKKVLAQLRLEAQSARSAPPPKAEVAEPPLPPQSFIGRVAGGLQSLISHDFNSVTAREKLVGYCAARADEWIYDRGLDKMRLCADILGDSRIAFRPLPSDQ